MPRASCIWCLEAGRAAGAGNMAQVAMEAGIAHTASRGNWRGWYAIFVLVVASVFASLDRAGIPLQAEKIRASLGLTDTQLGLLQDTGIAIFMAIAAYPIAWLADRYDRR